MCGRSYFSVYEPAHYCLCKSQTTTHSAEPGSSQLLVLIKQATSLFDTKQIVINARISLSNSVNVAIRFMVA